MGQNFSALTVNPHFSIKPTWDTKVGVTIPFMSHQGEVQYRSNQTPTDRTTGGLGDISFDFSKTIGSGGAASLSASLTIPTGQYDVKRGKDGGKEILPSSFQKGSGLYSLTLGWDYSRDTDKGIWLYSLSYTHPFAMHLFSGENEFNDSYWKDIKKHGDLNTASSRMAKMTLVHLLRLQLEVLSLMATAVVRALCNRLA